MSEVYDESYFLRGKQTGKSLYENYRWMPDLTIPMCQAIVSHCGIQRGASILDFGCARGYTVRALRSMEYDAYGIDLSKWATDNCDETVADWIYCDSLPMAGDVYDWVIAKDVLEHVKDLDNTIDCLMDVASIGVFVVVPLAHRKKYDVLEYEKDVTHIHRQNLQWWAGKFHQVGWSVEARYRVVGVKDNYAQHTTGNGFVVARRI